jgi:hypothetical protein
MRTVITLVYVFLVIVLITVALNLVSEPDTFCNILGLVIGAIIMITIKPIVTFINKKFK